MEPTNFICSAVATELCRMWDNDIKKYIRITLQLFKHHFNLCFSEMTIYSYTALRALVTIGSYQKLL